MAAAFDAPVSTLLRWIGEMDWPRRRDGDPTRIAAPMAETGAAMGRKLDFPRLRAEFAIMARQQLEAARLPGSGMSLDERERNARVIASLTRSIDRLDRGIAEHFRAKQARKKKAEWARLTREIEARPARRPPPPRKPKPPPAPVDGHAEYFAAMKRLEAAIDRANEREGHKPG